MNLSRVITLILIINHILCAEEIFHLKMNTPTGHLELVNECGDNFLISDDRNATGGVGLGEGSLRFANWTKLYLPIEPLSKLDKEITISFWSLLNSLNSEFTTVFYAKNSAGNRVLNASIPWGNNIYWDAGNEGNQFDRTYCEFPSDTPFRNKWHHWMFTKNAESGELKIYLNGQLIKTQTQRFRAIEPINEFFIGNRIGGFIDDFRVFNEELTPQDLSFTDNDFIKNIANAEEVFSTFIIDYAPQAHDLISNEKQILESAIAEAKTSLIQTNHNYYSISRAALNLEQAVSNFKSKTSFFKSQGVYADQYIGDVDIIESGSNSGNWSVWNNNPEDAIATNSVNENGENVVNFYSGPTNRSFVNLQQSSHSKIQWTMKFPKNFQIDIGCNTSSGYRRIRYTTKGETQLNPTGTIDYTLEISSPVDGWVTVRRDLIKDLFNAQPDVEFISIREILIKGDGQIKEIICFDYDDADQDLIPDLFENLSSTGDITPDGDIDNDNLSNLDEIIHGTFLDNPDSDNDQLIDGFEIFNSLTSPHQSDSNNDGISDANENPDQDNFHNLEEQEMQTSAHFPNTNEFDYSFDYEVFYNSETDGIDNWWVSGGVEENISIVNEDGKDILNLPSELSIGRWFIYNLDKYCYDKNIIEFSFKHISAMRANFNVVVMTNKGKKTLKFKTYLGHGNNDNASTIYIDYGFGADDNKWFTYRTNIQSLLEQRYPDHKLNYIISFEFMQGDGLKFHKLGAYSYKDEDGDLIPDEYEDQLQFNIHASGDLNGDGISNLNQLISGELQHQLGDDDGDGISNIDEINIFKSNPNFVDFDGTFSNLISINPAEPSNTIAQWQTEGNSIYNIDRRGSIEYDLNIDEPGFYRLKILATQNFTQSIRNSLKLQLYVDDQFVKVNTIDITHGVDTPSIFLTPYLTPGSHKIKLVLDNIYINTALRINAIELSIPNGTDSNDDGILDWVESYLTNTCRLMTPGISSKISPMQLEGKGRYLNQIDINGLPVNHAGLDHWYKNIDLDPLSPTEVQISWGHGIKTATNNYTWDQTNIAFEQNITLLSGSSLLLNAFTNDSDIAQITVDGQTYDVTPNSPLQYKFSSPGTYSISALINSNKMHSLNVNVLDAPQAVTPWIWTNKERPWHWHGLSDNFNVSAEGMEISRDSELFSLKRTEVLEKISLVARTSENGLIAAVIPTHAFWLRDVAEGYINVVEKYEDGSSYVTDTMFGINIPDGCVVDLWAFSGIVFEDGQASKKLTKNDFDHKDEFPLHFYRDSTRQGSTCHRFKVFQENVLVGQGHR